MTEKRVLVANSTFVINIGGSEYSIIKGVTMVREGHPVHRASPESFEPIHVHFEVEQATASPGEQRTR